MKVIDLIHSNKKTAFSFEILPPLKGTGIEKLYQTIDTLREFDPKYINITTHRSEYVYKDLGNGLFQRNRLRRRPGTVAVAAAIQNKYNITVVPHILCSGFTREETEYVLLDLQFLNITELLVLRGDKAKHESVFTPEGDGYHHAIELQEQINNFNKGIFVDGSEMKVSSTPFSYGVACYPEKHEEAPNIETDLYWLKKKVENGAEYAVTQLFYDNRKYFEFVEQAKAAGIAMCVATSTPAELVQSALAGAGLDAYMEFVTTTGEAGRSKQFPDVYELALRRLEERHGHKFERPWVFEDAVFGLKSSGTEGFKRVGIYDSYGRMKREDVRDNCDIFIDSYEELDLARVLSFEG